MKQQKFEATLVKDREVGSWTKINIPFDAQETFGQAGYIKVKGMIDNYSFSGLKIMPVGDGSYQLAIKEEIRKALKKGNGDKVSVVLEADDAELEIPADLADVLKTDTTACQFFEGLTESNKNYFVQWIITAKRPETRADRVLKSLDKLKQKKKFHDV